MSIAIYTRQSVDKKDSISIENQIEFCKKEFINTDDYKIYTDRGFSGKNTHRPSFEEMIIDIKSGSINKVIVYKLDRISRSVLDFSNIINLFEEYNVDFISSTEKFDTSSPMGKAMLSIIVVFAQLERETIQIRIKDNYYSRGSKKFFMGGRVPYGFTKTATHINGIKTSVFESDSYQAPNVIEMYDLYANSNMSLGKIAEYLNKKNIPSASGGNWNSSKISTILRNPTYVQAGADVYLYYKNKGCVINNDISDFIGINGCFLYGKRNSNERKFTNVENHLLTISLHEGIIDSNTWLLCQYKIDDNKQIKNSGKGKYSWLSGRAKCGYCGYSIAVVNNRGYKYFTCKGKSNLKICNGHSKPLYVDKIEAFVKDELIERVEKIKNKTISESNNNSNLTNKIKLQTMEIDKQIENLISQMAESNNVVTKYINEKISELDNTKNTLLEKLKKSQIESNKTVSIESTIEKIENWDALSIEEKKDLCASYIEKVFVKDDVIEIEWYGL